MHIAWVGFKTDPGQLKFCRQISNGKLLEEGSFAAATYLHRIYRPCIDRGITVAQTCTHLVAEINPVSISSSVLNGFKVEPSSNYTVPILESAAVPCKDS